MMDCPKWSLFNGDLSPGSWLMMMMMMMMMTDDEMIKTAQALMNGRPAKKHGRGQVAFETSKEVWHDHANGGSHT